MACPRVLVSRSCVDHTREPPPFECKSPGRKQACRPIRLEASRTIRDRKSKSLLSSATTRRVDWYARGTCVDQEHYTSRWPGTCAGLSLVVALTRADRTGDSASNYIRREGRRAKARLTLRQLGSHTRASNMPFPRPSTRKCSRSEITSVNGLPRRTIRSRPHGT